MILNEETRKRLLKLPTGNIEDNNTILGAMDSGIKPLDSKSKMIGRAMTVRCYPGDNLAMHQGIYAAEPGDVLVFACGGYDQAGHFGDVMATACQVRGISGVVLDGSCRDAEDIKEMGFPMFVRALNPTGTVKESLGDINVPVRVGGVEVHPGDIIFGDCDGVVVVRKEDEDEVFAKAEAKFQKEIKIVEELRAGKTTLELFGFDKLIESRRKR